MPLCTGRPRFMVLIMAEVIDIEVCYALPEKQELVHVKLPLGSRRPQQSFPRMHKPTNGKIVAVKPLFPIRHRLEPPWHRAPLAATSSQNWTKKNRQKNRLMRPKRRLKKIWSSRSGNRKPRRKRKKSPRNKLPLQKNVKTANAHAEASLHWHRTNRWRRLMKRGNEQSWTLASVTLKWNAPNAS